MASFNKVLLMGNLTRDVELSYTPSNTAIAKFGMACNRNWTGQDGQKREEVTFIDLTMFGRRAEVLNKYLHKGDPLFVEGRLHYETWDAKDGGKRHKLSVVVEDFQFIGRGGAGGQGGGGGGGSQRGSAQAARQSAPAPASGPTPDDYASDPIPEEGGDDIPF
ncbi:MAG: Single-stranded DNA-binding protein [Phycisphaerae bacterium]|nr:Single-stranded DNA-binding protein [Phycisphaerae bacterium]